MTVHALRESRAAKFGEFKRITDAAAAAGRDLTDAEATQLAAIRADVEKIDLGIHNAEFLAENERRASAEPIGERRGDIADLESRVRLGKAVGEYAETGRLTGAEAEYAAERRSGRAGAFAVPVSILLGERRAVTTTTPVAGPGGNLVATDLGPLADRLRPSLAVEAMGSTMLTQLTNNLDLPMLAASGAASFVAEHGAATRSDPKFSKVSMAPKTVAAEYELSRRMLIQAPQLEPLLRRDIGLLLAQALDFTAIKGGGANEPDGILSTAGVARIALGANGGALTLDATADMIAALDAADVTGARGFITNAKVRGAAMKMKDANDRPYGVPAVFHGEPVAFTSQVPANLTKGTGADLSALIYGAWADLVIGYWSAVDIVLNPYHGDVASKGGALLHAFLDADVAVRRPESFIVIEDIVT